MQKRFRKIFVRIIALLVLIACTLATPALAESYLALVTASNMVVYADAGCTNAIGYLPQYTSFSVVAANGDVNYISWNGYNGFTKSSDSASVSSLAQAAYFNTDSRVYAGFSPKSACASVSKGLQVNIIAQNGDYAMVERAGVIGYAYMPHLTRGTPQDGSNSQDTDTSDSGDSQVVVEEFSARVTASQLVGYQSASTSAQKVGAISQGTVVTVHAYNSVWAFVDNKGAYAFCQISGLERIADPDPADDNSSSGGDSSESGGNSDNSTDANYLDSSTYSNEEKIYLFLVKEVGLNSAAACGVLANIKAESSFRPTAYNSGGGSYGICQWTGGRYTRLKNYCSDNGYDYTTLKGQLYFLKYELANHYTKTLKYLLGVENSASGAYDAGYYYCYNFEVPANRASVSVKRGNVAKDTYWPKYH